MPLFDEFLDRDADAFAAGIRRAAVEQARGRRRVRGAG